MNMVLFYKRKWIYIFKFFSIIILILFLFSQVSFISEVPVLNECEHEYTLLWWTPFTIGERRKLCGSTCCRITNDRRVRSHTGAFLFYGSDFNYTDLPIPRGDSVWAILHEESSRNQPLLIHDSILSLFNFSSTFSRFSDVPLTLQYLRSLEDLTDNKYYKSFQQKNRLNTSPIIYIQSDCVTPINRDSYVRELMNYIDIDSYGQCLNNKQLPDSLKDPLKTMMSDELLDLVSNYKFSIAFENAICEDYITEKLWRPLIAGSIPLYIGSPSVMDWLPNNTSAIFPLNFQSPKKLAEYLLYLSKNEKEYNKFIKHKIEKKVENKFLIENFQNIYDNSFIHNFECFICRSLKNSQKPFHVSSKHYNCSKPISVLSKAENKSNWWYNDFLKSKCEGDIIRQSINQNVPINKTYISHCILPT